MKGSRKDTQMHRAIPYPDPRHRYFARRLMFLRRLATSAKVHGIGSALCISRIAPIKNGSTQELDAFVARLSARQSSANNGATACHLMAIFGWGFNPHGRTVHSPGSCPWPSTTPPQRVQPSLNRSRVWAVWVGSCVVD